jgi:spermidine synthase
VSKDEELGHGPERGAARDDQVLANRERRPSASGHERPSRAEARSERANLLRLAQSYLVKRILDSRSTPHNPVLEVVLVNGRCVLNSRSVNYSFGSLHRVFEEAFARLHLEKHRFRDALLLGCGAGSVVQILRGRYSSDCAITAVEIDPVVIELAREHFLIDRVKGLEIVCADAREFVEHEKRRFDLVVVDLFVDDQVPAPFRTREFLESLRKLLAPGGWLVFNAIDDTKEAEAEADELERSLNVVFPGFTRLDLTGNRIFRVTA